MAGVVVTAYGKNILLISVGPRVVTTGAENTTIVSDIFKFRGVNEVPKTEELLFIVKIF